MFNIFSKKKPSIKDDIKINMSNMPKHIAIIMDGNGRWAKERNLPRSMGHKAGVETIKVIVRECSDIGIKYLTLYAFSTENWKRSNDEVNYLMKLLVEYLRAELNELHKNNVVVNWIGDISKLPTICQDVLNESKAKTKDNSGLVLNLALNYGGRAEILNAFKKIYKKIDSGEIKIEAVTEEVISNNIYTAGMPDPDLIIRPSGEQRISNFLLWQCAYSEFWSSNIKWPDFKIQDLHKAIIDYQKRERRFGSAK